MSVQGATCAKAVRFNCLLCGANCGMVATVDGERILKVEPDRDHPDSGGYTCSKGRAIPGLHHSETRLDQPRLYGNEVSWDVLLDDLAARLQALVAEAGPDRIARYSGTGFIDAGSGFAQRRFFRELGTKQLYGSLTLDVGPCLRAAELVTGFVAYHPCWSPDDPASTLAIIVGMNPPVSGGYTGSPASNWTHRLRTFRRRGGELWVIDPRQTKTARQAERHLAPRPGSDVFLFAWLVRELLEEGFDADELEAACEPADVERLRGAVAPFELEPVAARTGLAECDLLDLLAAIRRRRKVSILAGTGVSFAPSGVLAYWLIWATMIITGSLDREGGMRFLASGRAALDGPPIEGHAPEDGAFAAGPASRPDLAGVFGERPSVALADEIEAGEIRALMVLGGNPLASAPDPDRLRAALSKLQALVVFDTFEGELTRIATHVIPCSWITERDDFRHMPSLGMTRAYLSPALVPLGAGRRHSWWVFGQLGRRLGIDALDGLDPQIVDDETVVRQAGRASCDYAETVFAAGSHGVDVPFRHGWFHEKVLPGGRWRLAPRVLVDRLAGVWSDGGVGPRLVSGRTLESVNTAHYAATEHGPPPIHVSPDAARERSIATGDRIRVSTSFGAIEGRVHVDGTMAPGSIWISHGWLEQNVNRLTDPAADRLTGQPAFTGLPVRIERIDPVRS
jgi:anaerobic selenocysteine-containing dehydrogenase